MCFSIINIFMPLFCLVLICNIILFKNSKHVADDGKVVVLDKRVKCGSADKWLIANSWPQAQDCNMKDYYYLSHSKSHYFLISAPTLFSNWSGGWAEVLMVRSSSLQVPKLAENELWSQREHSATSMVLCLGCIAPVKPLVFLAVTTASAVATSS